MNFKDMPFTSLNEYGGLDSSSHLFRGIGMRPIKDPESATLIVFNGGADIGTKIYHERPAYRGVPFEPSRRDEEEIAIFNRFPNTFKLGICRGAQLLNCLNGGTLWQDVDRHTRDHMIVDTRTGEKIRATSTHHQMMRPNYKTGVVIATADESTRKLANPDHWEAGHSLFYPDDHKDTEIVWYPQTRTLCIQGHPEYVPGSRFADYCFELMSEFMQESLQFAG